jgi:excisionase family DNA binding protein
MTTLDAFLTEQVRAAVREEITAVLADLSNRPLVVTPDEAAHLLQVSRRLVDRWLAAGLLPRLPHTSKVLIPRIALEAFAEGSTAGAA